MQHSAFIEAHDSSFLEEQEESIQVVIANLKTLSDNYTIENLNRATRSYQALIHQVYLQADLSRISANQEVEPEFYSPTRLVLIKQEEEEEEGTPTVAVAQEEETANNVDLEEEGTLTVAATQEEETASNIDLAHKQAHKHPTPEVHLTTVETSSGGPVLRPTKPRQVKTRLKVLHSQVLKAEQEVYYTGDIVIISQGSLEGEEARVIKVSSHQVHLQLLKEGEKPLRRAFKNIRHKYKLAYL